jgi:hypothetical protein
MKNGDQPVPEGELLSNITDVGLVQHLLADLRGGLQGKSRGLTI